jgi:hypothetical protein
MDFPNSHSQRERMIAKGELVAQFLNVANGLPKQARVLQLAKACVKLQAFLPMIIKHGPIYQVVGAPATSVCDMNVNKKARRLLVEINRVLARYRFRRVVPSVVFWNGDEPPTLQTHAVPLRFVPFSKKELGSTVEETGAVETALELAEWGALDRLRQCKVCRTWFMAGRTDQTYCGSKCIRAKYNRSKLGKKKINQKRRERRGKEKDKILAEIRKARRS